MDAHTQGESSSFISVEDEAQKIHDYLTENHKERLFMSYQGLTTQEVNKRVALGKVNMMGEDSTQSVREIIKANVFTYFNGIFALLSLLLIIAGSFKNLTFLAVGLWPTL